MPRDGGGIYSAPVGTAAVAGQVIESGDYNALIADLVSDANAVRPVGAGGTGGGSAAAATTALSAVSYGSAQTLTPAQRAQARANTSTPLKGHLYGLTLSNNALDATNDIDIAVGEAASADATSPVLMVLSSPLVRRLDAAFGTGSGGRFETSISDATWHVYLIYNPTTGVTSVGFSTNASDPTGGASYPSGYTHYRRIGSIIRSGGAILAFTQYDDTVKLTAPVSARSSTSAVASALLTLAGIPTGIVVEPLMDSFLDIAASSQASNQLGDAAAGATTTTYQELVSIAGQSPRSRQGVRGYFTNTSAQLYFAAVISSGTIDSNVLTVAGWVDRRGRDA